VDATYNLANLLRERKHFGEALKLYTDLLARRPDHELAWNNTGLALLQLGHAEEARHCFAQTLQLNPRNTQALLNLGNMHFNSGELEAAIEIYRRGLSFDPMDSDLHLNLGNALLAAGKVQAAIASLRRAISVKPSNSNAHSALIFSLDFDIDATTANQQKARRDWYAHCIAPLRIALLEHYRNPYPERSLRVGYVSADFRTSSAALGFGSVLFNHDREQFEIYCYSNGLKEDALTRQFQTNAQGWRDVSGLTDAEAAAVVSKDAIDILIDLSAYMSGNRVGIFALTPTRV
jgi:predicted O-linked N-acetylglucosamine transferase (SPINDLY family)